MASLRDIRKRIRSFKASQKITRAMQMVAASKLKRAQDALAASAPFAEATAHQLARLRAAAAQCPQLGASPLLRPPPPATASGAPAGRVWVVLGSDRGLCGAFNAQLFRALERRWRPWSPAEREAGHRPDVAVLPLGRRAREYFQRRPATQQVLAEAGAGVSPAAFAPVAALARALLAHVQAHPEGVIWVAYNRFHSIMSQVPTFERLWPLEAEPQASGPPSGENPPPPILEPSLAAVADELVPREVAVGLWRSLLHSAASEYGSRMTAMDAATRNAGELIDDFTLQYNRARQAGITRDLMDIVGGAEALSH